MKNPIYLMSYSAGLYKNRFFSVIKLVMVLFFALILIYGEMHAFDLSVEIKRSGDMLWQIK